MLTQKHEMIKKNNGTMLPTTEFYLGTMLRRMPFVNICSSLLHAFPYSMKSYISAPLLLDMTLNPRAKG